MATSVREFSNQSILGLRPIWNSLDEESKKYKGFIESWQVQWNDPIEKRSVWVRLNLLSSTNGFRKVCEAWVVMSHRNASGEVTKTAMKQSFDLNQFQVTDVLSAPTITVGSCRLSNDQFTGTIISKGRQFQWDLKWKAKQSASFNFIPSHLESLGLLSQKWGTHQSDLLISGTTSLDGQTIQWQDAGASVSHRCGFQEWNSWIRCQSNRFQTEKGDPVDCVFEGFSGKIKLPASIPGPKIQSVFLIYQGVRYEFNTIWESLRMKSQFNSNRWNFEVERGDLRFRGEVSAENRDFAGTTYEDTDGSQLYGSHSNLAKLTLWVYRKGKLEQTLVANETASLEIVTRERNPYVQFGF